MVWVILKSLLLKTFLMTLTDQVIKSSIFAAKNRVGAKFVPVRAHYLKVALFSRRSATLLID
jgi:hypothetical protein